VSCVGRKLSQSGAVSWEGIYFDVTGCQPIWTSFPADCSIARYAPDSVQMFTREGFGLGILVLVDGEDQSLPPAVNVDLFTSGADSWPSTRCASRAGPGPHRAGQAGSPRAASLQSANPWGALCARHL